MALAATTQWEIRQDATASNVNGGGFNTANANFPTDATATSATGNSPVVSSATYTFVAGDDGAWVYIKAGTDWTPGFYQIDTVSGGSATLFASIGAAVQYDSAQGRWKPSTVAGCATVASPTGGTFGVDYSQQTAAEATNTDLTCTTPSTTVTSAAAPFTRMMVGNIIHLTALTGAGALVGWYEIVNYTDTSNVVLDRTPTGGANITAGTFYVGGAMSLNSTLDDDLFDTANNSVAGMIWWVRYNASAISLGEAVSIAVAGTAAAPIVIEGYASARGDRPTGSTRPVINVADYGLVVGTFWHVHCVIIAGSSSPTFQTSNNDTIARCKITNTSTLGRNSITSGSRCQYIGLESISYRGNAFSTGNTALLLYCWMHESNQGCNINGGTVPVYAAGCIFSSCVTASVAVVGSTTNASLLECTLFGSANTTGIGVSLVSGVANFALINCIISGFVTGVSHATTNTSGFDDYNCYYNNDADVSAVGQWQKGPNDVTTNPSFTNVGQVTGTAGVFTAGNDRIVDTSKDFTSLGVVANQDHIYIVSGTGVTAGIYGITSIATTTNPNDTLVLTPAPGTNVTADKVYQITTGHNFLPTGSL